MLLFLCSLLGVSVGLFVMVLHGFQQEIFHRRQGDESDGRKDDSIVLKLLTPYFKTFGWFFEKLTAACRRLYGSENEETGTIEFGRLVERAAARTYLNVRRSLQQACLSAGKPMDLNAEDMMGSVFVGGVIGLLFGMMDHFVIPSYWFVGGMGLVGAGIPTLWLYDAAKRRMDEMRRVLPVTLDLLTLAVEAGMDFTAAIALVTEKQKGNPLAAELNEMLREVRMGKARREALRNLDARTGLDELSTVVTALVQADKMGSDLGPILRIHSDQLRVKRFQNVEKKSNEAPVKMLFPLLLFIFPTVFIVLFGPIWLYFTR